MTTWEIEPGGEDARPIATYWAQFSGILRDHQYTGFFAKTKDEPREPSPSEAIADSPPLSFPPLAHAG